MPKYNPITVDAKTFEPTGIVGNTAGWQNGQDSFVEADSFSITRREVKPQQTTRKSSVRLNKALSKTCETTCAIVSRGSILLSLDAVASVESTEAEREEAYDDFVALLNDPAVREAVVKNQGFYA